MNRRQFLLSLQAAAAASAAVAESGAKRIEQVDIVHHTHTDVGYTELPSVVRDLQKRYLDLAVDTCRRDPHFRWTVESLVGLDDWWRDRPEARHQQLVTLVKEGRMDVMAMPFNQTPFLNADQWRQMMSWIPEDLWRTLKIRAAMQNDVNGMPRAGAMALLDHGISRLLMGLNSDSGGPPFPRPTAFRWKMPDGRVMFVWLGEHYGSLLNYIQPAREGNRLLTDEAKVRAAHEGLSKRIAAVEAEGYGYPRLILTFTHPFHWDNGSPFPTLGPFIEKWNQLGLKPALRMTTATEAALGMEQIAGTAAPELSGEWTDWWANGDASGPREVAASRAAKRYLAAAKSPVFGAMPAGAAGVTPGILRDLCLFDEHTWGASNSISQPYSLDTLAQYVEKSDLAYRPMGAAEALLIRRTRARLSDLGPGVFAINATPAATSTWAKVTGPLQKSGSLVDAKTGERCALRREGGSALVWLERLEANAMRVFREDPAEAAAGPMGARPEIQLDADGWPRSAVWSGAAKPLFEGAPGEFIATGLIPPANRRTITQIHANPDKEKRDAVRKASLREAAATYGKASQEENAKTLLFSQEIRHERLANAKRTLELWKQEPRARITVRFDRLSSLAPEVFHIGFTLPEGCPMPRFSSGGVPFTPYRDQLRGSCRDYFGIDGWAHYESAEGSWLWVTRDAPLVAVGSPHVVERHQEEPAQVSRILAMVFDNCWHTNFVADSHGTMEFRFELVWREKLAAPADLAAALATDPIVLVNPTGGQTQEEINDLYRS
jgi:hypothetical protein